MAANATDPRIPSASPTSGTGGGRAVDALVKRFEDVPDKTISLDMGNGDSWAKDVRTGKQGVMLKDVEKLMGVLGLKVVDCRRICITPAQKARYDALEVIAAHALNPQPLDFEEPE